MRRATQEPLTNPKLSALSQIAHTATILRAPINDDVVRQALLAAETSRANASLRENAQRCAVSLAAYINSTGKIDVLYDKPQYPISLNLSYSGPAPETYGIGNLLPNPLCGAAVMIGSDSPAEGPGVILIVGEEDRLPNNTFRHPTELVIDGYMSRNVVLQDCFILYKGARFIIENATFIHCSFAIADVPIPKERSDKVLQFFRTAFDHGGVSLSVE